MKRYFLCLIALWANYASAQHSFQALIQRESYGRPLAGVSALILGTDRGGISDEKGRLQIEGAPAGQQIIVFRLMGYEDRTDTLNIPQSDSPRIIRLSMNNSDHDHEEGEDHHHDHEMETIVVSATRGRRSIDANPSRVEVLNAEELGEKAAMNSTNIAMLLRESTGIQMQQTSASSANQSIRIQGLDGRYTQILKDGFPLYGGFAGGLSIMQIPPLDLQQVEVIKGSSSTLYGGGAIAGLVNLVSKMPAEEGPELNLMVNQTSAGGTTLNGFYAQRFKKMGLSFYTSANRQAPFDPNEDDFSDIPRIRSLTINPRLFFYPDESSQLWIGFNASLENRTGGDLFAIDGQVDSLHQFTEQNLSDRFATQVSYDKDFDNGSRLSFRNSINWFEREILVPDYRFLGNQIGSFTEVNVQFGPEKSAWIMGANAFTDQFRETQLTNFPLRDQDNVTIGVFAQNNWEINRTFSLESGLRTDYHLDYGSFILPRVSLLYKINPKLLGRIGGGFGYKTPTIFTEESETMVYRGVLPIDPDETEAERSLGGNIDLNYQTLLGEDVSFSINQLFFYTQLNDALLLQQNQMGQYTFNNITEPISSRGIETNIKLTYGDFKLFFQYVLNDVQVSVGPETRQKPLTPKHAAAAILVFEKEGQGRIGLESYYTGKQFRSDFSETDDFWIVGLMGVKHFQKFSLFLNFENFLDTRLSRFQPIVQGPIQRPSFAEIWAPTDGFVVNGGFIFHIGGEEE
ncbi:MAG: TonB-dependent receptor [Bacteroidota bacterium]